MLVRKTTKTYSLDLSVVAEVRRTKGAFSESERVNRLLRMALDLEQRAALDEEIARFFGSAPSDREERRGFEAASLGTWARD
jgi:hypothetical protein